MHPEQKVVNDRVRNGMLPWGVFDTIYAHRLQQTTGLQRRTNPNKVIPTPDLPLNESVWQTDRGRKATHHHASRTAAINGKTWLQAHKANLQYTRPDGRTLRYSKADLKYDLEKGYLEVRTYANLAAIITDEANRPCALHPADASAQLEHALEEFFEASLLHVHSGDDPLTEKEAMAGDEAEAYFEAMGVEISALEELNSWDIRCASDRPQDAKLYKGKFVLKKKPPANRQPGKHKARYCISDPKFLQRVNDVDCFSPMSRLETIRYLLSLGVERNWDLIHTDIMNAFPTAPLEKPVWMEVPRFLHERAARQALHEPDPQKAQQVRDQYKGKVCYVTKSLYGLANAPRSFNKHLDAWFRKNGYHPATGDGCLYIKYNDAGTPICAVASFVDDALVAGTDAGIADYRARIKADFGVRDYGVPTDFVGMEISYNQQAGTCKISQSKYINKMAQRYNVTGSGKRQPVPMLYDERLIPATADEPRCDPTLYRSIVGALHFSAHSCRPDICNAVRELSKHLVDPSMKHYDEARKVLRYCVDTHDIGITYMRRPTRTSNGDVLRPGVLYAFSDASYAECITTRRSTSGYVILLNGGAISWSSFTQRQVSLSSSDSEYKACSDTARECLWLRKLDIDFSTMPNVERMATRDAELQWRILPHRTERPSNAAEPTTIYEDNESCIKWVKNPVHHNRVKHIDVSYHFIRDEASPQRENIAVKYIPTSAQLADIMTKQLNPKLHWNLLPFVMNFRISEISEGG
jgi:hypothetical protein